MDGAFDPLHAGHVAYLTAAYQFSGAPLVVSLASDADIRAKGREPLLPVEHRAFVLEALAGVRAVHVKDRPTEDVIKQMRPRAYIKGADWSGRLPAEQVAACSRYSIPIHYTRSPKESSSRLLADWSIRKDAAALASLESLIQAQKTAPVPWAPVTDYSFEARKAIEGQHPQLIKDVFQPKRVLDVGCGPGHLVRLLEDLGVEAWGMDRQLFAGGINGPTVLKGDITEPCAEFVCDHLDVSSADLVISRECLEHLTARELRRAVTNLCRLSSRFVYVTTRFARQPTSLLSVDTSDDLDPTHITMLNQDFLRTLFVLEGCQRRADLEQRLDWMGKGRVLVYEHA